MSVELIIAGGMRKSHNTDFAVWVLQRGITFDQ